MSGFILTTHADHNPLVEALREKGVDVRRIAWGKPLPSLSGCHAFYGNLFDEIKDWPGLVRFKAQLRQNRVPYVFWNRDAPWNTGIKLRNIWALKLIKPIDIYLSHSLQDAESFGGVQHYFPNAAQSVYCQNTNLAALRDNGAYCHDVSFFGSFGNTKDRNARARREFLDSLKDRLVQNLPNVRFSTLDTALTPLSIDEQLSFIRGSKINLNYGAMCDLEKNQSWGLPERVFGIPAAGGLLLTQDRKMLKSTFNNSPASFESLHECVLKIGELLSDFNRLRSMAEQVHAEVIARHTYRSRATQFLEILRGFRSAYYSE